jgi:Fe-S-cluster containining protein
MRRIKALVTDQPTPDAAVNCQGCTQCCYHPNVNVHPACDDLSKLDTEQDANGYWCIKKRADGACAHLGESGCTVYDHRPRACRQYDCRVAALVSHTDAFDGNRHPPAWVFQPKNHHGEVLNECFRILGVMFQTRARNTREPNSVGHALRFALDNLDQLYPVVDALKRMSPEQACQALGLQALPTLEEHRALALAALAGIKTAS